MDDVLKIEEVEEKAQEFNVENKLDKNMEEAI